MHRFLTVLALASLPATGGFAADHRGFVELCQDDDLEWEQRITIMRIMNDLMAPDCEIAAGIIHNSRRLALPAGGQKVSRLESVVAFGELTTLLIPFNKIGDVEPLKRLRHLEILGLRGNRVSDVSPLLSLPHLKALDVAFNPVMDLKILDRFPSLAYVVVDQAQAVRLLTTGHRFRIRITSPRAPD